MSNYFVSAKKFTKNNIKSNSKWYLILCLVVLFGIALGVYLCASGNVDIRIFEDNKSASVFDFVAGEANGFSLFFYYFLRVLLSIVILLFLCIHIYVLPLSFLYIGYQGYILGLTATSLVVLQGFAGAVNIIFFLLPINLLSFATLFVVETALIQRLKLSKRYSSNSFFASYSQISPAFLMALCITFVAGLLYAVVYPIVFKSMIIVST